MIAGLVTILIYVLVVALFVALDAIGRRNARIARLEAALADVERRHQRARTRAWHAPPTRRPPTAEVPLPVWTVKITPPGKPVNELANYVRHAGAEWRNGPTHPVTWPAKLPRPDGAEPHTSSVARGWDDWTHGRPTVEQPVVPAHA